MIRIIQNNSVALFDVGTGKLMTKEQSEETLLELFEELSAKNPYQMPLSKDRGNHIVSISLQDDHLVPSYNMMSIPSLRPEFARLLKLKDVDFVKLDKRSQKIVSEFHCKNDVDVKKLLPYSTLKIGSIGSRVTNRDVSYELIIDDVPTDTILEALRSGVDIVNEDKSNTRRTLGYVLTCRSEVAQFCEMVGKETEYLEAVYAVEHFQKVNNLKERYREFERIDNHKEETLTKIVKFAA